MANTFRKIYKKTGSSGTSSDYTLVGNVGVGGVELDIMKGATSEANGEIGLVPKPVAGQENYVLAGNGSFNDIADIMETAGYKYEGRSGTGCEVRFNKDWCSIFLNARVSLSSVEGYVNTIILPEYVVSDSDAVTMTVPALRSDWRPENNIHLRISFSKGIRNASVNLQTNLSSVSSLQVTGFYMFPRTWFSIDVDGKPGIVK